MFSEEKGNVSRRDAKSARENNKVTSALFVSLREAKKKGLILQETPKGIGFT
jgi:hypothetical protein